MTPKLLLALALVGAVHGEPSTPTKAMPSPATPNKSYTAPASLAAPIAVDGIVLGSISDDWKSPDRVYTFLAGLRGKIVVHDEPTVTKKPDGSWEITFEGKKAEAASWISASAGGTPMTPAMLAQMPAPKFTSELEAASHILPPPPPTVDWLGWPVYAVKAKDIDPGFYPNGKTPPDQVYRADIQIGLRSDGCVVWRERK